MKIKLAEGRRLRDPITKAHLRPDEVREVPTNIFWRRRLRDGDVVPVEAEPPPHHETETV
jgi:hypothetical protein